MTFDTSPLKTSLPRDSIKFDKLVISHFELYKRVILRCKLVSLSKVLPLRLLMQSKYETLPRAWLLPVMIERLHDGDQLTIL